MTSHGIPILRDWTDHASYQSGQAIIQVKELEVDLPRYDCWKLWCRGGGRVVAAEEWSPPALKRGGNAALFRVLLRQQPLTA